MTPDIDAKVEGILRIPLHLAHPDAEGFIASLDLRVDLLDGDQIVQKIIKGYEKFLGIDFSLEDENFSPAASPNITPYELLMRLLHAEDKEVDLSDEFSHLFQDEEELEEGLIGECLQKTLSDVPAHLNFIEEPTILITGERLLLCGACDSEVARFMYNFPLGVWATEDLIAFLLQRARYISFDMKWLAHTIVTSGMVCYRGESQIHYMKEGAFHRPIEEGPAQVLWEGDNFVVNSFWEKGYCLDNLLEVCPEPADWLVKRYLEDLSVRYAVEAILDSRNARFPRRHPNYSTEACS